MKYVAVLFILLVLPFLLPTIWGYMEASEIQRDAYIFCSLFALIILNWKIK